MVAQQYGGRFVSGIYTKLYFFFFTFTNVNNSNTKSYEWTNKHMVHFDQSYILSHGGTYWK